MPTTPRLVLCELADPGVPSFDSYSPFCMKVHRALRAAGLPYERRHGAHPGAFRAQNPLGQVPVLLIGSAEHSGAPFKADEAVADSTAILARLMKLAPGRLGDDAPPRERAEALLWEELADGPINAYVVASRWADERNWPTVRDVFFAPVPALARPAVAGFMRRGVLKRIEAREVWRGGPDLCWRRFIELLDALEGRAPESGFWIGGGLSVADLGLFGQLHSLRARHLTPWQADEVARRPRLSAYLDRVDAATRGY